MRSTSMRACIGPAVVCVLLSGGLVGPAAAGPLTPPSGPVAPTGPQVIMSLPFTITQPGSYVVGRNLTGVAGQHGIRIQASHVSLDLRGFGVMGVPGSLSGVFVDGARQNVKISNGTIGQWGARGIDATTCQGLGVAGCTIPDNDDDGLCSGPDATVTDTTCTGNGGEGIECGNDSKVDGCDCGDNGGTGCTTGNGSKVTGTTATGNVLGGIRAGIGSAVTRCVARGNAGDGIVVQDSASVWACVSTANAGHGLVVGNGGAAVGCTARGNQMDGIRAQSWATVTGNTCDSNGGGPGVGAGINAVGTGARIDGNTITQNEVGVMAAAVIGRNIIIRNVISRSTSQNFDVTPANTVGEAFNAIGNSGLHYPNPWGNLVY